MKMDKKKYKDRNSILTDPEKSYQDFLQRDHRGEEVLELLSK